MGRTQPYAGPAAGNGLKCPAVTGGSPGHSQHIRFHSHSHRFCRTRRPRPEFLQ